MTEREPEPPSAAAIFGSSIDTARRFVEDLAREGENRGLIGPREVDKLWSRHVLNCAILSELVRPGNLIDVGSGAGLPGIPLAIARPDVHVTLLEPMERRVAWLEEESHRLGLDNVTVVRGRAEDAPLRGEGTQVTARAVSALRTLIPMTAPLCAPGGELILMKGQAAPVEVEAARKQIAKYRLGSVEVLTLGADILEHPTTVVRAKVEGDTATHSPTKVSRETIRFRNRDSGLIRD